MEVQEGGKGRTRMIREIEIGEGKEEEVFKRQRERRWGGTKWRERNM